MPDAPCNDLCAGDCRPNPPGGCAFNLLNLCGECIEPSPQGVAPKFERFTKESFAGMSARDAFVKFILFDADPRVAQYREYLTTIIKERFGK